MSDNASIAANESRARPERTWRITFVLQNRKILHDNQRVSTSEWAKSVNFFKVKFAFKVFMRFSINFRLDFDLFIRTMEKYEGFTVSYFQSASINRCLTDSVTFHVTEPAAIDAQRRISHIGTLVTLQ